jgi:uncharacterized protein (TIGR00369 family)
MVEGTTESVDFDRNLGFVWDERSSALVRAHLEVRERHLQPYGVVHGGVYAAIAGSVASAGAGLAVAAVEPGKTAVALETHTSFLRAVGGGRRIDVEGVVRHGGRRVQLWTVSIRDATDSREVAISVVRLLVVERTRD